MPTAEDVEWPLTGRDEELAAIDVALRHGAGVLLAGPAGVGKTRVAGAVLARHGGGRWVRATASATNVPLGALVPLLRVTGGDPASLMLRAHASLRSGRAALLAVDDAHRLDDVSATLLMQAAAERTVRIVVTLRTGEPAPEAVTALWKDGLLTRVDLGPLSVQETGALVGAVLGGRLASDSTRRLHHLTSGNPLWLRHLVPSELAAGRFVGSGAAWRWTGAPRLGSVLASLLDEQLGTLDPDIAAVLELLAVGEPLAPALLDDLGHGPALEEAAARGLVTAEGDAARLAHPLYGEAALARAGTPRARRRRGELVGALLERAPADGDVLRTAVLALDADRPVDAKVFADAAGVVAGVDVTLAIRLARAACAAGGGFEMRLTLALLLGWDFQVQEAGAEYARAAVEASSENERVRLAMCRFQLAWVTGDVASAEVLLAATAEESAWARGNLLAHQSWSKGIAGRLAEAETESRAALADPDLLPQAATTAGWVLTAVLGVSGRLAEARDRSRAATAASLRAPETVAYGPNIRYWEITGLALAGAVDELAALVDRTRSELAGESLSALFLPLFDSWHALVAGRPADAAHLLVECRTRLPGHGGGWTALIEATLAMAFGMSGDAEGAAEAVGRARAFRHPGSGIEVPAVALGQAWASAAAGAVTAARSQARAAAGLAAGSGQHAVEVLARQAAVGFGDRAQADDLARLAGLVEGPRAPAAAAHAAALRDGHVAGLLDAATRFEEAGLLLPAAEAAAQAVLLAAPVPRAAAAAARRATALAARCPGARTAALLAVARPLPITEREREVAMLIRRLPNREIAQLLNVSVRTVEGHVYRACVKLGLADRGALAAYVTGPESADGRIVVPQDQASGPSAG